MHARTERIAITIKHNGNYKQCITSRKIKDYERNNIKSIIINMRKVELVSKMQDELYKNALKNKDFEVF